MRLLITGGRIYRNRLKVWDALDRLHAAVGISCIIEGGAAGADALARQWAAANMVGIDTYPADWKRWGPSAGPRRNGQMLASGKPDAALVFPGGRGTADASGKAILAGIPVLYGEVLNEQDIKELPSALAKVYDKR
jgi:hypothetical protein